MKLEGAVAVVTGGASGIGRALARALALDGGCAVVVADINEAGAESVAAEIAGNARGGRPRDRDRPANTEGASAVSG